MAFLEDGFYGIYTPLKSLLSSNPAFFILHPPPQRPGIFQPPPGNPGSHNHCINLLYSRNGDEHRP